MSWRGARDAEAFVGAPEECGRYREAQMRALRAASRRLSLCCAPIAVALIALASQPASAHDVAGGLEALNQLCRATIEKRDYDEAQRICKRISFDTEKMAPGSQAHVDSLRNMGDIKARVENFVDADAYYSTALRLVERAVGPDSEAAAEILAPLAEFKVKRGKYLDAAALAQRALAIREKAAAAPNDLRERAAAPRSAVGGQAMAAPSKVVGQMTAVPSDVNVAVLRARYADLLSQSHQFLEAEAVYNRALAVLAQSGAANAETYARTVQHLGEMYERRAQYWQAEQQYRRVVDIVERNSLSYRLLAGAYDRLAFVCEQQDRVADAALYYRRAVSTLSGTAAAPEVLARIQAQLTALEATPVHGTQ